MTMGGFTLRFYLLGNSVTVFEYLVLIIQSSRHIGGWAALFRLGVESVEWSAYDKMNICQKLFDIESERSE